MSNAKKFNFDIDEELDNKSIGEIDMSQIVEFHNHPFKIDTERVEKLAVDIKENGLISAIVVRKLKNSRYEILSGHHRFQASKLAGFTSIRAEVLEAISDNEAQIIVTGANLYQRGLAEMLPSEKVKSVSIYCICSNKRGKKVFADSENLPQNVKKYNAREKTASEFSLSRRMVDDCMNLYRLSEDFLDCLDNDKLTWSAGISISFLNIDEQQALSEILNTNSNDRKTFLATSEAEEIKELSQNNRFSKEAVLEVLSGEKHKSSALSKIILKRKDFSGYFPCDMTDKEVLVKIKEALDFVKEFKENVS